MDHTAFDTSISTQVVLAVTLAVLMLLVTFVNMIVWMVTRLISGRNDMLKYCQAGIVFANLIAATVCLPAQLLYISFGYWTFGMPLCIFTITVNSAVFVAVMWLVTVLVMDRVLKSSFQDVYLTFRKKYSRAFHLLIWAILLLLTLPFFLVEFLKQSSKLGNDRSRFHCHVPFDATAALFLVIFGFASPLIIAGVMMTFLWYKIIKGRLIKRKKISPVNECKYITMCDSRSMTPWGRSWLNDIENRVKMGPNNVLPALRRHSIGNDEPEANTNLPQERRNSLPEAISEAHTISEEKTPTDSQYYSTSRENSWGKAVLAITSHTPSLSQVIIGTCLCGMQSELSAKARPSDTAQHKQFRETKTACEKTPQNRVSYDLGPSHHYSIHQRTPVQSFCVNQTKDDLNLPGTVQTDERDQQTAEIKTNKNSVRRKEQGRRQSSMSFTYDMEPLPEHHKKGNLWVRGSRVENDLHIGYDDDGDDEDDDCDDDDDDEEVRVSKVLTVMVGLNTVLWLPLLWTYCQQTFCDSCHVSLSVWIVLKILGQISLITNAVCLLVAHKDWKPLLKYILSGFGSVSFQCLHRW